MRINTASGGLRDNLVKTLVLILHSSLQVDVVEKAQLRIFRRELIRIIARESLQCARAIF
jgi:hypothetical protein